MKNEENKKYLCGVNFNYKNKVRLKNTRYCHFILRMFDLTIHSVVYIFWEIS